MRVYKIFFLFNTIFICPFIISMDNDAFEFNLPSDISAYTINFCDLPSAFSYMSTCKNIRYGVFGQDSQDNPIEKRFLTFIFKYPMPDIIRYLPNKYYQQVLQQRNRFAEEVQEKIDTCHAHTISLQNLLHEERWRWQVWKACDIIRDKKGLIEKLKKEALQVKELLDKGANPNYVDGEQYGPLLHDVCRTGNYFIAELLLQNGVSSNVVDSWQETALFKVVNLISVSYNHNLLPEKELKEILLSRCQTQEERDELQKALQEQKGLLGKKQSEIIDQENDEICTKMLDLLIRYGLDVNKGKPCHCNSTILICQCNSYAIQDAMFENNYKVIKFLREKGARFRTPKQEYMMKRNCIILSTVAYGLGCWVMSKWGHVIMPRQLW